MSPQVETPWLNYLGISLAVLSVGLYAFVKPTVKKIGTCSPPFGLYSPILCAA
jgi:hypothetical protein